MDPQSAEYKAAIGSLSYNQLVEKIVASKETDSDSQLSSEGWLSFWLTKISDSRVFARYSGFNK